MSTTIHPQAKHEAHPMAAVFPMMDKTELEALKEGIRKNGFREGQEIVLLNGLVLDGRNRLVAALETGTAPQFRNFDPKLDGLPTEYVLDINFRRRNLNPSQRAAIGAAMLPFMQAEMKARKEALAASTPPAPQATEAVALSAAEAVAEKFGGSATMVKLASRLQKKAPDLYDQVLAGNKTVNAAKTELDQREADAKASSAKEGERTARRQAIEEIEKTHGKEHAITVAAKGKKICKSHDDLLIFAGLPQTEGKKIFPFLLKGWSCTKAQKFLGGKITMDSSLEDLINFAIAGGHTDGTAYGIMLGGWHIEVTKPTKEE